MESENGLSQGAPGHRRGFERCILAAIVFASACGCTERREAWRLISIRGVSQYADRFFVVAGEPTSGTCLQRSKMSMGGRVSMGVEHVPSPGDSSMSALESVDEWIDAKEYYLIAIQPDTRVVTTRLREISTSDAGPNGYKTTVFEAVEPSRFAWLSEHPALPAGLDRDGVLKRLLNSPVTGKPRNVLRESAQAIIRQIRSADTGSKFEARSALCSQLRGILLELGIGSPPDVGIPDEQTVLAVRKLFDAETQLEEDKADEAQLSGALSAAEGILGR
ncbi:MAG: hypothetical protein FD180_322 [Planctomycetota bacterium]|nr:MAG: hypothetical protein FD180_322 [Planctomycetota bacterium]